MSRHSIRRATLDDASFIARQLQAFDKEAPFDNSFYPGTDTVLAMVPEYISKHYFMISYRGDIRTGILGACYMPHPLVPSLRLLKEDFWYVDPKYRGTRAGYLLLRDFTRNVRETANIGLISIKVNSGVSHRTMQRVGWKLEGYSFIMEV